MRKPYEDAAQLEGLKFMFRKIGFLFALALLGFFVAPLVAAEETSAISASNAGPQTLVTAAALPKDPVTAAFYGHTPGSEIRLDHDMWSQLLSKMVVYAGYSTSRLSRGRKRVWIDSKIGYGNDLPSRLEGNRVVMASLETPHHAFITHYRAWLEDLPNEIPLASLSRREQLAYWLNLYNAHVMEIVTAHYPAETTKQLRSAPGAEPKGIWYQKTLSIAGVPLSLRDIETRILFPIWDDPLVMYGLWQGAIGGPTLPLRAYHAASIWDVLRDSAHEFINSNRGVRPRGETLKLSIMYGWASQLFEDQEDLRLHIESYLEPPFADGVAETRYMKISLYDWHLADMSGGSHHQGQWNQTASLGGLYAELARPKHNLGVSDLSYDLITNIRRKKDLERIPVITIDDCPPEGCARPKIDAGKDGADQGAQ